MVSLSTNTRQHHRVVVRAIAITVFIALLLLLHSTAGLRTSIHNVLIVEPNDTSRLQCWNIPGGEDTMIVLRTSATEIADRFPVHTRTTLQCYPHYLIFSDLAEEFMGEEVLDALASVSPEIVAGNADFDLYRRLKQGGRTALDASELSGGNAKTAAGAGELGNPGWKLDKWKFLPMLNKTYHERPDMRWYVFVEADTYILWSMLQKFLAGIDHTKPLYMGDEVMIGDSVFAHGGTGFVVSRPALQMLVEYYSVHKTELEAFTDEQWAGDHVQFFRGPEFP